MDSKHQSASNEHGHQVEHSVVHHKLHTARMGWHGAEKNNRRTTVRVGHDEVLNNVVVALPKVSFRSPTHRTVSQLSVRSVAPLPFFWYFLPQFRQAMRRYESPLSNSFHCSLSAKIPWHLLFFPSPSAICLETRCEMVAAWTGGGQPTRRARRGGTDGMH